MMHMMLPGDCLNEDVFDSVMLPIRLDVVERQSSEESAFLFLIEHDERSRSKLPIISLLFATGSCHLVVRDVLYVLLG
ncbi:hypothetical protein M378DRAFT_157602 [Amanita muscaria Koide BX008]|uniref:Uncharacterized protein n=1 Tax=Amanita muscaria (strain Koide BX008) TaxID=946122 RepID=A0A0C2TQ22_AMAMK|nr:hypothetical protein M378DRAFT_157602 [Amanita muscaria Koide BX008]